MIAGLIGSVSPTRVSALELEQVYAPDPTDPRLPTFVVSDPNDPDRLFVGERTGKIRLVENGQVSTFLNLESIVMSPPEAGALNDHGLFSMAFSPDFESDHLFYVTFSGQQPTGPDDTVPWQLSEFEVESGPDGDTADPTSRRDVLTIDYPPAQLHYAGQLQFGPDGYLYTSTGDGGPHEDPDGNAQNLQNLFGKILRIDPGGSGPGEYSVPGDNPFVAQSGRDEVWSYGFRNPWRFSFDRLTGDLVIGDVGHHHWEEVDFDAAPDAGKGLNFGWSCFEGTHALSTASWCEQPTALTAPVFEYPHGDGECSGSITGGYVVRDSNLDDLNGRYLYADGCVGELRSLVLGSPIPDDRSECLEIFRPISFGEDAAARIYVASMSGEVYRLTDEGPDPCAPDDPPPPTDHPPPPTDDSPPADGTTAPPEIIPPSDGSVPDTDAPETTLTKGTPDRTNRTQVKFKFTSDEGGSTFECKRDKRAWKACSSPKKLKNLDQGRHRFKVRATDLAGNVDLSPAKDKFKVID